MHSTLLLHTHGKHAWQTMTANYARIDKGTQALEGTPSKHVLGGANTQARARTTVNHDGPPVTPRLHLSLAPGKAPGQGPAGHSALPA